jgi:hypothetical protein
MKKREGDVFLCTLLPGYDDLNPLLRIRIYFTVCGSGCSLPGECGSQSGSLHSELIQGLLSIKIIFPSKIVPLYCTFGWVDIGTRTKVPLRFVT